MKRTFRIGKIFAVLVMCLSVAGALGCTREAAAQIAALSGSYLGDVVATWSTASLLEAWGLESDGAHGDAGSDAHNHDAGPLHEHEH